MVYLTNRDGCSKPPGIALFGGAGGLFIQLQDDELIDEQGQPGKIAILMRRPRSMIHACTAASMDEHELLDGSFPSINGVYIETKPLLRFFPVKQA
jgi:hypothetical protein